ncbi:MAG: nucleotidyltransferase domain-containing protein [Desulfobacterales bacterium]
MLNEEVKDYVNKLTGQITSIESIWLFGSRVNRTYRPDSDWDLIVFGTPETLDELSQNPDFNKENIDLLVVYNDIDFKEPWPTHTVNRKQKSGSLLDWQWNKLNERIAFYFGAKPIINGQGEETFEVELNMLTANRIYPE